jgi:hypothetical protein
MNTFRDSVLASMPDVTPDMPSALADAIAELLYAFDMQLPMADQLRAIHLYQELLNDQ